MEGEKDSGHYNYVYKKVGILRRRRKTRRRRRKSRKRRRRMTMRKRRFTCVM